MVKHHDELDRSGEPGIGQGGTLRGNPEDSYCGVGLGKIQGFGVALDANGNIKVDKDVDLTQFYDQNRNR